MRKFGTTDMCLATAEMRLERCCVLGRVVGNLSFTGLGKSCPSLGSKGAKLAPSSASLNFVPLASLMVLMSNFKLWTLQVSSQNFSREENCHDSVRESG
jgi:hypothetical protein